MTLWPTVAMSILFSTASIFEASNVPALVWSLIACALAGQVWRCRPPNEGQAP